MQGFIRSINVGLNIYSFLFTHVLRAMFCFPRAKPKGPDLYGTAPSGSESPAAQSDPEPLVRAVSLLHRFTSASFSSQNSPLFRETRPMSLHAT